MDKYIFEKFITSIEGQDYENFLKYLIVNHQEEIEQDNTKYLMYYPQSKKGIQLIVDIKKEKNNKFSINDFKFHHLSKQEWEFKIITAMKKFPNTYIVKRPNNTSSSCIRIVNENLIGKDLKPDTTIKGQVCGIVLLADIFKNEDEYRQSIPVNKEGNKTIMKDGYLIPFNLIKNNDAKLSEAERNKKNHSRDNLLTFKSKLKNVKKQEISMFGLELPYYYSATIDTTYGDLDIIIPNSIYTKYNGELKGDNVIIGELLLSCNLCIGRYKNRIKNIKE